jgi:calcineurin-like phosphoesterase family protein
VSFYFYGDPHGVWEPLLRGGLEPDDTVIIVGDCDLDETFKRKLAPLLDLGVTVRWIIGNHDVDNEKFYDHLVLGYPEGDLGGKVQRHSGVMVAGLGGIFKSKIWYPKVGSEKPNYLNRAAYLRSFPHQKRWRKNLPLTARCAIYSDEVADLAGRRADILVTHEAPTTHPHGFAALDRLAADMRVRWHVHGHHHRSYESVMPGGKVRVHGLAKRELWRLPE